MAGPGSARRWTRWPPRSPGLALGVGALLFAGTLAAHGDAWWPGLLGGLAAVAALAQRAVGPVFAGARARLPDRAAREALTRLPRRRLAGARRRSSRCCIRSATSRSRCSPGSCGAARPRTDEKYAGLRILRR